MSAKAVIRYTMQADHLLKQAEKLLELAKAAQAIPPDCKPADVGHLHHISVFVADAIVAFDPN